jgi:CheY-like chemotaxis protein
MKHAGPAHHHACSVLVVESDSELREVLKTTLVGDGYRVTTAGSGREALMQLRSTADTCVIVLDPELRGMTGTEFRAAQLLDRSLAWIPIVLLAGDQDLLGQARTLNARSVVRKPVNIDELRHTIRSMPCRRMSPTSEHPASR